MDSYNREDLERDLTLMVKAGLLELFMREDGQWVYSVPDAIKNLTMEEQENMLLRMYELDDQDD
jgi:hypothetical protein